MKVSALVVHSIVALLFTTAVARAAEDMLVADFEGRNYGAWKVTG